MLADSRVFFLTQYVDNILIYASNTELLKGLKDKFANKFEMKDIGEVSQYLGMKITREDGSIKFDKKQYMNDILRRFDVLIRYNDKTSYKTPMERDLKLTKTQGKEIRIEQVSISEHYRRLTVSVYTHAL